MRLGFALNAALALGVLTAGNTDAFSVPVTFTRTSSSASNAAALRMVGSWDNDNFLANLSGSGAGEEDLSKLTTEEQAALFRQFMANTQPPPAAAADPYAYAPPMQLPQKTLKGGTDISGRKVGRNRDADSIANTSDLYFAQLKRDSSIRQQAFFYGDEEVADAVFADPSVKELPTKLTVNPFLVDRQDTAEELALMELVDEELSIIRKSLQAEPAVDVTTAGVKYKDKLMAKRKVKTGGTASVAPSPIVSPSIPPPVLQEISEPVVHQAQVPVAPVPVVQQTPVSVAPAPVVQQVPVAPAPVVQQVKVPVAPAPMVEQVPGPVAAIAPAARAPRTAEESRQDIRTLQGLLLKHRGGSGFGSGILRGDEVNKFEATVQDVVASLRSELADASPAASAVSPVVVAPVVQVAPPVVAAASAEKMGPTLACVEAAVLMYKNSPVEMQSIMAPTLRAALVAAVTTCTGVIGDGGGTSVAATLNPADAAARMMPTLACVEGAVQMYKNSPPELQPVMAMTVRAALLAAVTTCDQIMGGIMPQQPPASVAVPVSVTAPVQSMATPAPVQVEAAAAVPAAVVAEPVTQSTSYSGDDANSQFLEGVYNSLVAASGGEKYGLRNLSPSEASALADQVHEMKGMLADELSSGIPEPVGASAGGATSSRYQEMLARARAEKAAGN